MPLPAVGLLEGRDDLVVDDLRRRVGDERQLARRPSRRSCPPERVLGVRRAAAAGHDERDEGGDGGEWSFWPSRWGVLRGNTVIPDWVCRDSRNVHVPDWLSRERRHGAAAPASLRRPRGAPRRDLHRRRARPPGARTSRTSTARCSRSSTCPRRSRARCSRATRATRARCGGCSSTSSPDVAAGRAAACDGGRGRARRAALRADLPRLRRRLGRPARRRARRLRVGLQRADEGPAAPAAGRLPRAVDALHRLRRADARRRLPLLPRPGARARVRARRWTSSSRPTPQRCRASPRWVDATFPRATASPAAHRARCRPRRSTSCAACCPRPRCRTWGSTPRARPTSSSSCTCSPTRCPRRAPTGG